MPSPTVVTVVCASAAEQPPSLPRGVADSVELRSAFHTADLERVLPGTEVVFVWDFSGTQLRDGWRWASDVRWVHVASAGVEPLVFPELHNRPVVITNSRGIFDQAIAEFVLGAILAAAKDLPETIRLQQQHRWQHRESRLVHGSTVLVIGAGSIGGAVARLSGAVGCRVVGLARQGRVDPDYDQVLPLADLDQQLPLADYVVITAPLTPGTSGLIGDQAFARARPGMVLINVGRGPIVDEAALVRALDAGTVRIAVLDVFSEEPLPPAHRLWSRPDIIVSPHMCGDFEGYREALVRLFADNLERWRSRQPLLNVIDKSRGY